MLKIKLAAAALASAAALVAVPAAHAADQYYLKVDGIPGTATAGKTPGAIAVEDFSLSVENPVTVLSSSSGGAGAGKAKLEELKITKAVDETSPIFFKKMVTGEPIAGMELAARAVTGGQVGATSMRWSFQPVFVTEQEHSGTTGDGVATETLTFSYGALQQSYGTGPKGIGNVITVWNQVTNSQNPIVPEFGNTFSKSRFLD
ncbi:MAG TPA: type VI secretion system tube protein Hcp [Solirubrobacter sp.]|nr:type VI secretion system tube protein Hcp [Solirubrobacter sp.]